MKLFLLYWHTIRYLRLSQIIWRLWFKLYKPAPNKKETSGLKLSKWDVAKCASKKPSMIGPTTFSFLNKVETLEDVGWNSKCGDKLWFYNFYIILMI